MIWNIFKFLSIHRKLNAFDATDLFHSHIQHLVKLRICGHKSTFINSKSLTIPHGNERKNHNTHTQRQSLREFFYTIV